MHIRFAEMDEQFIRAQIASGYYTNETELVRDAVRRMRESTPPFYTAVMEGEAAIARGETTPYSPALMNTIKKRAATKAKPLISG